VRRAAKNAKLVRGVDSITGRFRPGRFSNWRFHAGKRKKKIHQMLTGKSAITKKCEQLLERFQFAHDLSGIEERLKRAERNHVQAKSKARRSPTREAARLPTFQLK